eukprot:1145528-Pelagomonas_calceolata.AAC.5
MVAAPPMPRSLSRGFWMRSSSSASTVVTQDDLQSLLLANLANNAPFKIFKHESLIIRGRQALSSWVHSMQQQQMQGFFKRLSH